MDSEQILAKRLGRTVHVSPLRTRLQGLRQQYPCVDADCLEDWLVEVANARGARIVSRPDPRAGLAVAPPLTELSNEQLAVAICQLQALDRPQMLRLAAQLISRETLDLRRLCLLAEQERVEPVVGALARQALRVDSHHTLWRGLAERFGAAGDRLTEPVLHWTRLATPLMKNGRCNAAAWKLVS